MQENDTLIETVLGVDAWIEFLKGAFRWADQNAFAPDNLIQVAIIAVGLVVTFALAKKINTKLIELRPTEQIRIKSFLAGVMFKFAVPILLLVWLGVFGGLYIHLGQPYALIETALILTLAWAIIRLGSSVIADHFIGRTVATFVWGIAALHVFGLLIPLIGFLDAKTFHVGETTLSIYDVVASAIAVAVFLWLALFVVRMLETRIQASKGLSQTTKVLTTKILKILIIVAAFLFALGSVGIDLTALVVFGGAIGVGLGFGLQKIFSNLVAGFILLTDKSIKPGDTLLVAGQYGRVETLGARYVSVITRDGIEHLVPNEELITNRVENWSHSHENVRLKIPLGIHYESDLHQAIELCMRAANRVKRVLGSPVPTCLVTGFGDSSVDLEIRIWIRDPMNGCANVKNEVLLEVWDLFHEHGIQIPYPQRDLHVKSISRDVGSTHSPDAGAS